MLGQDNAIVPVTQRILHALKRRAQDLRQRMPRLGEHLEGIAEHFAGDAQLVRIGDVLAAALVKEIARPRIGLGGERIPLRAQRRDHQPVDDSAELKDLIAQGRPGGKTIQKLLGRSFLLRFAPGFGALIAKLLDHPPRRGRVSGARSVMMASRSGR